MEAHAGQPSRSSVIATGWITLCLLTPMAIGDPTGLNNMPTADTPPDRAVVFQFKSAFGSDVSTHYFGGFKMGLEPFGQRLEWGVDGTFGDGALGEDAGPAILQFKLGLDLSEKTALGLGIANIGVSDNARDDVGQPFKYAVLSQDLGPLRAHAGYGLQQDGGNSGLIGLDKTVELFERDLMLRADLIQIDDEDQWLGSLGFIYFIDEHFAVESWVSQPFEDGNSEFTIKFDFAIQF